MQTPEKYLKQSFDEILFEGRNKEYGSYALRKIISVHLKRGLIISAAASAILILFMSVDLNFRKKPQVQYSEIEIELSEPPPYLEQLPPAVPPAIKKVESSELTEMEVVRDEEVVEVKTVKTDEAADTSASGDKSIGSPHDSEISGDGNTIYSKVDKNPEYPGGISKYLTDRLEYPKVARENNIQGVVDLIFVVNTDGTVSDVRVLKPLGGGCDEEAVRVISEMRRWKPGLRGGVPVRVWQRTTIKFNLEG